MSGTLPKVGRHVDAASAGFGAPAVSRSEEACARARRAACRRAAGEGASPTVLEAQGAPCGVAHRHHEARRRDGEAPLPLQVATRAPVVNGTGKTQDADTAHAGSDTRLSASADRPAALPTENAPSTLIATAAPIASASSLRTQDAPTSAWARLTRMWRALRSWLQPASRTRAASVSNAQADRLAALGFREFTAPRRRSDAALSTTVTRSSAQPSGGERP